MSRASLPILRERWLFALAALGSLAISVPRVCRDLALMGDSPELVAAAHVWGVPRAPGYPLWTLLGYAASKLPLGSDAFRVNLTSAFYHAIAIAAAAVVAQRLSRSAAGGLATALTLALSKSFLLGSEYAEVFPLNDALFAIGLWLAVRVSEASPEHRRRELCALFASFGLALSHHEMSVLALPALAVFSVRPLKAALSARRALGAELALALLGPFALCQLLLWLAAARDPIVSSNDLASLGGLLRVLLRSDYGGFFGAARLASTEPAGERVGTLSILLLESLGPVALVASVVGLFGLLRERRAASLGLLLGFAVPGPLFAALFRVAVDGEIALAAFERYATMSHVALAVLTGVGVAHLVRKLPSGVADGGVPLLGLSRVVVALAAAAVPGLALVARAAQVDLAGDHVGGALARDFLRGVPDGALVLVSGDFYNGVALYACAVERQNTRVKVVAPGLLSQAWRREQHERRHPDILLPEGRMVLARSHELVANELPKRAVYVVPPLLSRDVELGRRFRLVPERLLARVYPDQASVALASATSIELASGMASGRDCEGCVLELASVFRPSQHVQVLIVYSVAMENASRLALRLGADDAGRKLNAKFLALDAAVGAQLTLPGSMDLVR